MMSRPDSRPEGDAAVPGQAGAPDPLAVWLGRAATGDAAALRHVLEAVAPPVVGVVRVVLGAQAADTDDVVQEALLAIHDALPRFRGDSSFVRYARRIAVRIAMGARRRHTPDSLDDVSDDLAAAVPTHDERVAGERRLQAMRALLDELPPAQADSLAMRVVLGCTLPEVAEATRAPLNTVRSRIRMAREHIKARIAADPRLRALFEIEAEELP
jgi:RNA polymerase sigma factor (sigma-70 family)